MRPDRGTERWSMVNFCVDLCGVLAMAGLTVLVAVAGLGVPLMSIVLAAGVLAAACYVVQRRHPEHESQNVARAPTPAAAHSTGMGRRRAEPGCSVEEIIGDRPADQEATLAQFLFLQRLRRLVTARELVTLNDEQRRLVDYALYSTYRDCAALGIRAEAGAIIGLPRQRQKI